MTMTVHSLMVPVMQQALTTDKRLMYSDFHVHTHCFRNPPANISVHAKMSGIPRQTIRRSASRLAKSGWATLRSVGNEMIIMPWMPWEIEELVVHELRLLRDSVPYMGEWLMKCLLDLIAHDRRYYDNVRPPWLVKGDGSGRLELDRWYPEAQVAFEFQGPQHYRVTSFAPTEAELDEQIMRDHVKASICSKQGIRLIAVRATDLDIHTMRSKIDGLLHPFPVRENGPLFRYIENVCMSYINYASRNDGGSG